MFGIGMPELLVILAVALIFIGPKKLPDLAKSLGKALGEFKRATNDLKQSLEQEADLGDVRDQLKKTDQQIRQAFDPDTDRPTGPAADGKGDAAPPIAPTEKMPQAASDEGDADDPTVATDASTDASTDAAAPKADENKNGKGDGAL